MAATIKQGKNNVNSVPEASSVTICLPDRNARIVEIAYYKAESRVFEPGHKFEDWLEAEREFSL